MTDRFKTLLERLKLSPSEFADRIGVQRSSVSHVLSGRNKPSTDFLEKILNVFPDIDATWLITGNTVTRPAPPVAADIGMKDSSPLKSEELQALGHEEKPVPAEEEPVDHIIIVYKDNTFRLLKPSRK